MLSTAAQTIIPAVLTFVVGVLGTPILTRWLYKNEMWKKASVSKTVSGESAPITSKLHNDEARKVPRMGGIIVWMSVLIVAVILAVLAMVSNDPDIAAVSFLARNQTWLPLFTLIVMSIVGFVDDYLVCKDKGTYHGGGLSLPARIFLVAMVGLIGGWWFWAKLGMTSILIPGFGMLDLGIAFIPVFIVFMVGMYSGGIIDGIDGLAGGLFGIMFGAYAIIAFYNNQIDLAAFSMAVSGGLLAFLWFNIPPARFFLSETGTMGLTTTLVVIAFLTNAVFVLPIIALPLIVTTLSVIIQLLSKKFRNGKKVLIVSPLHNHFQALGWPPYKVVMRYWIIAFLCAITGVVIILIK